MAYTSDIIKNINNSFIEELFIDALEKGNWDKVLLSLVIDQVYLKRPNFCSLVECSRFARQFVSSVKLEQFNFKYKTCHQFFKDIDRFGKEKKAFLHSSEPAFVAYMYLTQKTGLGQQAISIVSQKYSIYRERVQELFDIYNISSNELLEGVIYGQ